MASQPALIPHRFQLDQRSREIGRRGLVRAREALAEATARMAAERSDSEHPAPIVHAPGIDSLDLDSQAATAGDAPIRIEVPAPRGTGDAAGAVVASGADGVVALPLFHATAA